MRQSCDIKADTLYKRAKIISFNETHLNKGDTLSGSVLGLDDSYQIFRNDRDENGGGVAIMVDMSLYPEQLPVDSSLEIVAVRISYPSPVVVVSVYRPPSTSAQKFVTAFTEFYHNISGEVACVVGDFNEDILLSDNKPCSSMFKSLGLRQCVEKPKCDSGTLIDHMYVTPDIHVKTDILDCYYSDHDFVVSSLDI